MAMAVEDGFAIKAGQWDTRGVSFEEFTEKKSLTRQGLGPRVMGKKVHELVSKDANATRFEADDRNTGFDLRREFVEDLEQKGLGTVEHAMVVERASAA